ncbi:helix-turn-helix domain-containing protein [Selenomonas sp. KH1T6]|uniref:helix-turn-helix domain-containing protein n=1 Tax=Selenomonas sp. KH1T6 TaxID=3158784 RepID=UPI0008A78AA1|nr:Transposase [Selenomonas ruminantium]
MEKYKSKTGRQRIQYSYTGEFDGWVDATMKYMGTLMPPTLSKRATAMLLLVAGMGNAEIVALTGMCIRSVRALRKTMEEQEPTSELFTIKPGSGRKKKTEGVEEQVWAELDTGNYCTNKAVANMLKEKFGIEASVNLASRLVKRWKQAREDTAE